jgi:hypothetical protein
MTTTLPRILGHDQGLRRDAWHGLPLLSGTLWGAEHASDAIRERFPTESYGPHLATRGSRREPARMVDELDAHAAGTSGDSGLEQADTDSG